MPRPYGGAMLKEEIESVKTAGADAVVCLLEEKEIEKLLLQEEEALLKALGITYIHFPIADFQLPQPEEALNALVDQLKTLLEKGKSVAIHCHGGIGRSTLIAGSVLISMGLTPLQALELITKARGVKVPDTEEQKQWLLNRDKKH